VEVGYALIGIAALLATLVMPFLIAGKFWQTSASQGKWWLHLFLAPAILAVEWASVWLIFWSAHDDGDGAPGLGLLVAPSFLLMTLVIVLYYVAALIRALKRYFATEQWPLPAKRNKTRNPSPKTPRRNPPH